ncbi:MULTISPECIES: hypothetical protein [Glycomyces]|uniref:Uncharacterized protein n=2 Tax=Glycomyces TaxID=58113 RepID=A0A9X3PNK7_9ACTN|nr:hypothetical protein [Glycomyces lechevalierae]MDA1386958.1 hypothetical protein [Glycomyces lechevalierae]MDR7341569.1 hypothetical protein [Glycomyces lechevalierae]
MTSRFRSFASSTRGKKILIISGAALVLLIGIIAVTIAIRPERKTCEEWMAHAFSEPGFESNIGPACLWGGTDPDKAYSLEELEDISREMEESGEGGDLGDLLPEDESTETESPLPSGYKMCEDWLIAPEDEICDYYEDLMNEPVTEEELQVFVDYHEEYTRCVDLLGNADAEDYDTPEFLECEVIAYETPEPSLEELRNQED